MVFQENNNVLSKCSVFADVDVVSVEKLTTSVINKLTRTIFFSAYLVVVNVYSLTKLNKVQNQSRSKRVTACVCAASTAAESVSCDDEMLTIYIMCIASLYMCYPRW